MTPSVTFRELLDWNEEAATFWNSYLTTHPNLLELPCGISGAVTVQDLVRHIWRAELIWAQRIAGLPQTADADIPKGPLVALFGLHKLAAQISREVIDDPAHDWRQTLSFDWLPPQARTGTHRKYMAHALLHGHRHWAQLATLVRAAGFPSEFKGDLIFSPVLA
jgi:uncharacterized damage-inducible protein DinB